MNVTDQTLPTLPTQVAAIILAAGFSTRMGCCKATLPWLQGHSLLTYQIHQFLQQQISPIVILGSHNQTALQHVEGSKCIVLIHPDPTQGKVSSIQLGLTALPTACSELFISAVDQPRTGQLYFQLWQAHKLSNALITLPSYQGRQGHPLLISSQLLPHLKTLSDSTQGLRQLLADFKPEIQTVETSVEALWDLNTPAQYESAYSLRLKDPITGVTLG